VLFEADYLGREPAQLVGDGLDGEVRAPEVLAQLLTEVVQGLSAAGSTPSMQRLQRVVGQLSPRSAT